MGVQFKNILIPVDFTINTRVAIQKAVALLDGVDADIHLFHVLQITASASFGYCHYPGYFSFDDTGNAANNLQKRMENWKQYVFSLCKDVRVSTSIVSGTSIEKAIAQKASEIEPDLILIGKNSHHSWLPFLNTVVATRLAKKTSIPVLIVKPGAIDRGIKTVVIPVGAQFPRRKIEIIKALRKKGRIHIRLVTFPGDDHSENIPSFLLHVYRALKNNVLSEVSCDVIKGTNKARAILDYCENVDADLLVVNPETETKIGWPNKQISDVLPVKSKTQVLAVQPF